MTNRRGQFVWLNRSGSGVGTRLINNAIKRSTTAYLSQTRCSVFGTLAEQTTQTSGGVVILLINKILGYFGFMQSRFEQRDFSQRLSPVGQCFSAACTYVLCFFISLFRCHIRVCSNVSKRNEQWAANLRAESVLAICWNGHKLWT